MLFNIDGFTSPALVGDQRKLLWDWMIEQADARQMYKQRSWQAVTNRRLKTVSLVVRALQPVSRILSPAIQSPKQPPEDI